MRKLKKVVRVIFALAALFTLSIIVGTFIGNELSYKVIPEFEYSPISYTTTTLTDSNFIEAKQYIVGGEEGKNIDITSSLVITDFKIPVASQNLLIEPINKYVFEGQLTTTKLKEYLTQELDGLFKDLKTSEKYNNLAIENIKFEIQDSTLAVGDKLRIGTAEVFMGNCNFFNEFNVDYILSTKDYSISDIQSFEDNLCEKYSVPENPVITNCTNCTFYPVDKKHPLTQDYAIEVINADGIPGGQRFSKDAYGHLVDMYAAAVAAGHNMRLTSAYRSYTDQQEVYEGWVQYEMGFGKSRAQAESDANTYSALPGFSEHQLGTTADISSLDCIGIETVCAANERFWLWLKDHAHEYGFVMSYPFGKDEQTGYIHEPWHYRYIGIELATEYKTKYDGRSYLAEFLRNKKLY